MQKKGIRGPRREKSLLRALQNSSERLILLQGEPGSGKSVALRHTASILAKLAIKSKSVQSLIPVFVNLKELKAEGEINSQTIREFVLETLNRPNDRDIDEFLSEEFDKGLRGGNWFFLFDSFDEIPRILSSIESDEIISNYGTAIYDFLHGMNNCRGVLASRQFRGPNTIGWPRFKILGLTNKRKENLAKNYGLPKTSAETLLGEIELADPQIKLLSSNPMFLGLLIEYINNNEKFPRSAYMVYKTYIDSRFQRDEGRVEKRFGISGQELKGSAEKIAFSMISVESIGLDPSREKLKLALSNQGFTSDHPWDKILDALEYIKLARGTRFTIDNTLPTFSFSHRRFQEFFATSLVIKDPERVTSAELLMNARWRETAVTLLQLQPPDLLSNLLTEAEKTLFIMNKDLHSAFLEKKRMYTNVPDHSIFDKSIEPVVINWPKGLYHLLSLLQEGLRSRPDLFSKGTRALAGGQLNAIYANGTLLDKKWVLDVAGISDAATSVAILQESFSANSEWLKDVAYTQLSAMQEINEQIAKGIRDSLVKKSRNGDLAQNQIAIKAYFSRSSTLQQFQPLLTVLTFMPAIDTLLCTSLLILLIKLFSINSEPLLGISLSLALMVASTWRILPAEFSNIIIGSRKFFLSAIPLLYLFLSIDAFKTDKTELNLLTVLIFYSIYWVPAAYIIVSRFPRFAELYWWPFFPIWPVLIIRPFSFLYQVRRAFSSWRQHLLTLVKTGFVILLLGLIFFFGKNFPLLGQLVVALGVLGLLLGVIGVIIDTWKSLMDRITLFRLRNTEQASMSIFDVYQVLKGLNTIEGRSNFVRMIRANNLLFVDERTQQVIGGLLIQLEIAGKKPSRETGSNSKSKTSADESEEGKNNRVLARGLINGLSSEVKQFVPIFVDEVAKLHESLISRTP